MYLSRQFEEVGGEMYTRGQVRGFLHLYIGQEAIATGAISQPKLSQIGPEIIYIWPKMIRIGPKMSTRRRQENSLVKYVVLAAEPSKSIGLAALLGHFSQPNRGFERFSNVKARKIRIFFHSVRCLFFLRSLKNRLNFPA